jgi:hypothetical protein
MVLPPLVATFLMWLGRLNEVTLFEFLCAAVLLAAAWVPYCRWRTSVERNLPLFSILSFMYWVYYGLALFWGNRRGPAINRELSEQSIEQAMLLVVLGVACLWIGKWTGFGHRLVSRKVLDIHLDRENTWSYIRTAVLVSLPLTFSIESSAYVFGSGGRQFLVLLASTVPMALFVLLFRKLLRRQANHGEILLIVVFLVARFAAGIASGWLGSGVAIMITCSVAYLYEQRKIPALAVILVIAYILFFQAGKTAFRRTFWGERVDSTLGQRISFWSSESLHNWELTLRDPSANNWRSLTDNVLNRMSLLQQTANVLEMTPDVVPYQNGRLYTYMLVTFIPRAIWPKKPSVNDSSHFYQVAYGLTAPDKLGGVSIAVGAVAESFINFGWLGPFLIMIPVGIFFDYFQRAFLARDSGWVLNAIGIVLIRNFINLESQLAQYLGGIVQCIVAVLIVLWPVLHMQLRTERSQGWAKSMTGGLRTPLAIARRSLL